MATWTEDELFELAKRVHAEKPSSPPTLKTICMDFTIDMWQSWTDIDEHLEINPFEKMCKLNINTNIYTTGRVKLKIN